MSHVAPKRESGWVGLVNPGTSIPFDSIRDPGTYICNWSGHLLRVPQRALVPDGVVSMVGPEPLFVTKISDNPDVPLSRARRVAAEFDLSVSF